MKTQLAKTSFKSALRSCLQLTVLVSTASTLLFITGCATQAPTVKEPEIVYQTEWPSPPDQPRVRYIGDLRSTENLADEKQRSLRDIMMGKEKEGATGLAKPYAVYSDSKGHLYVGDTGLTGVVVFNLETKAVSFIGASGKGAIPKASGITTDPMGNVYVSDILGQRIVVFDSEGNYLNAFGGKEILEAPAGLAYNEVNQRLYVVDRKKHQIFVFTEQGEVDFIIGENGTDPGYFNFPTNIAVDAKGRIYVADTMNFRVQTLEMDGTYVSSFGQAGDRLGDFYRLKGIGVDTDGHIYAVDASYQNFQIFNQDGQLLMAVGEGGHNGPAGFYLPAGAHVDKNNKIFIADQYHQRIQMFEYLGDPGSDETR